MAFFLNAIVRPTFAWSRGKNTKIRKKFLFRTLFRGFPLLARSFQLCFRQGDRKQGLERHCVKHLPFGTIRERKFPGRSDGVLRLFFGSRCPYVMDKRIEFKLGQQKIRQQYYICDVSSRLPGGITQSRIILDAPPVKRTGHTRCLGAT